MNDPYAKNSTPANKPSTQKAEREDISIVMAVYNHESTVAEAIESVLMQEGPYRYVIYCLDDASTDKSARILSGYKEKYPDRIKVYTSPRNLGSGKKSFLYHRPPVKGRYWCLLAGDDYWTHRDKLAKQIAFLDEHPDYAGCSCNTILRNEVTGEERIIQPARNTWNLLDLLLRTCPLYVHTSSIVWRNIFLKRGSFLPPAFKKEYVHGDFALMHTMLSKGGRVQNIPEVMSCYRVTGRGVWSSKSAEEQAESNKNLVPKMIEKAMPLRYKIYISMQEMRQRSTMIRNLVPGPVNEKGKV